MRHSNMVFRETFDAFRLVASPCNKYGIVKAKHFILTPLIRILYYVLSMCISILYEISSLTNKHFKGNSMKLISE